MAARSLRTFFATLPPAMPEYTLPLAGLRVQNPDGEEAVLLWESAYNGWNPNKQAVVPVGEWLDDLRLDTGIFWMRYQGRNYNDGKGFQLLSAYADGSQAVSRNASSLKLCADIFRSRHHMRGCFPLLSTLAGSFVH